MALNIGRRQFISALTGASVAWPLAADALQAAVRRIGLLMSTAADDPDTTARIKALRRELERLGWTEDGNIHIDHRFAAGADADIERAFESFAASPNGGLLVMPDPTVLIHRDLVIALAARYQLPAAYPYRVFVTAGGLMPYDTDQNDIFRQAASYVDRILHGAKPADLPVQAPTKYETVLNLITGKATGFDIPPSLLVRADEVIE